MFPRFPVGPLELSSWRVVVLAGVLLCWALLLRRLTRLGYPGGKVLGFLVLAMPAGALAGHLFHGLIPILFGASPAGFKGLTVVGSLVGVLAYAAAALPLLKIEPLAFMDAAAFSLPLAAGIGRLACLLNGCCFGTVAPDWLAGGFGSFLAVPGAIYDPATQAAAKLAGMPSETLLWNLPLIFILHEAAVLATAELLYRNRARWGLAAGTALLGALMQESAGRFFIEFLRWDESVAGTAFNPWQLSVLALAIVFGLGLRKVAAARP